MKTVHISTQNGVWKTRITRVIADNGNGTATLAGTPAVGTAGTYNLTITANNGAGTNATQSFTLTVMNPAATSVTLKSSLNPSSPGQNVTFTATVTSTASSTPTGSVTFYDGAAALGTIALSGNTAALSTAALASGSHSITAVYSGDANFAGSSSSALNQLVKFATTTSITSSLRPSTYAQTVSFTATVTSTSGGPPRGSLTFKNGATVLGTATLSAGVATVSTSALTAGSHTITAAYAGTSQFAASSASLTQVVNKSASVTSITQSSANPSTYGQAVTFTAKVTGQGTLSGTVVFKRNTSTGSVILGSGALSLGTATYVTTTSQLPAGSDGIIAIYQGDANHTGSTSPVFTQTVNKAPTSTTLTASPATVSVNQNVVFTAIVSSATVTPTGSVSFTDTTTGTALGSVPLTGGGASLTTSFSSTGTHQIKAAYSANADFKASSVAVAFQVQ